MWRRLLFSSVIVLVPVALLAYGLLRAPRAVPSPLVGKPAPEFALPKFDGGELRLADLGGRVRVVNFWASWCVPCRSEAPALEAFWRRYRDAGVVLIGVNIQDRAAPARSFLVETGSSYPSVVDASGRTSVAYGVYGVPETFVIDRTGRILSRWVGAVGVEAMASQIESLLKVGS